jgi:hypothetical protein
MELLAEPSSAAALAAGDFQTYLANDTIPPVITAAGSRPFGCRPARAGTNRRTAQSCGRPTKSLSRNTVHRYQETPFNLT